MHRNVPTLAPSDLTARRADNRDNVIVKGSSMNLSLIVFRESPAGRRLSPFAASGDVLRPCPRATVTSHGLVG